MNRARCRSRIDAGNMHSRCYLDEGHEGVCRTYEGKPFTPTITAEDRMAQRMEELLVQEKPKPAREVLRTFSNNALAIALAGKFNRRSSRR